MVINKGVISNFQISINYIEEVLTEEISLEDVVSKSYMSLSSYYSLFKAITGSTLKDYIRKRRMTLAAFDLVYTDTTVLDIALKYQYKTYESFSRAFKDFYGESPSIYRKRQEFLEFFPPVKFVELHSIRGEKFMVNFEMNKEKILKNVSENKIGFLIDVDIDRFDDINNNYGWDFGDEVLKQVPLRISELMKSTQIDTDILRYGGDEFIFIIKDSDKEKVIELSNKILKLFDEPISYKDKSLNITVSIGIAEISQNVTNEQLIDMASKSMINAKREGRNRVSY